MSVTLIDVMGFVPDVLEYLDYLDLRCLRHTCKDFWVSQKPKRIFSKQLVFPPPKKKGFLETGIVSRKSASACRTSVPSQDGSWSVDGDNGNRTFLVANLIVRRMQEEEEKRQRFLDEYIPCTYIRKLFGGIKALCTMPMYIESYIERSDNPEPEESGVLDARQGGGKENHRSSSRTLPATSIPTTGACERLRSCSEHELQSSTMHIHVSYVGRNQNLEAIQRSVSAPRPLVYIIVKYLRDIEPVLTDEVIQQMQRHCDLEAPFLLNPQYLKNRLRWFPTGLLFVVGYDRIHRHDFDEPIRSPPHLGRPNDLPPPHWPWRGTQAIATVRAAESDELLEEWCPARLYFSSFRSSDNASRDSRFPSYFDVVGGVSSRPTSTAACSTVPSRGGSAPLGTERGDSCKRFGNLVSSPPCGEKNGLPSGTCSNASRLPNDQAGRCNIASMNYRFDSNPCIFRHSSSDSCTDGEYEGHIGNEYYPGNRTSRPSNDIAGFKRRSSSSNSRLLKRMVLNAIGLVDDVYSEQYFSRTTSAITPRRTVDDDEEEEAEPRLPVEVFNTAPRSKFAKNLKQLVQLHMRQRDQVEVDLAEEYHFNLGSEAFEPIDSQMSLDNQWRAKRVFTVRRVH